MGSCEIHCQRSGTTVATQVLPLSCFWKRGAFFCCWMKTLGLLAKCSLTDISHSYVLSCWPTDEDLAEITEEV